METVIWIVQVLLALAFLGAGSAKLSMPKEKLMESQKWAEDFSDLQIKTIGLFEILGAAGVIFPSVLNIAPILSPIAAAGLIIIMIGAAFTHFRRKEYPLIVPNVILVVLALIVIYGRLLAYPLGDL